MAGTAGDDDGFRFERLAINSQRKRLLQQIHRLHSAEFDTRPESLSLLLHPRHQFVAVNALGKTRIILDHACRGKQPARLNAGEHQRPQIRPRRIKRGGEARAT